MWPMQVCYRDSPCGRRSGQARAVRVGVSGERRCVYEETNSNRPTVPSDLDWPTPWRVRRETRSRGGGEMGRWREGCRGRGGKVRREDWSGIVMQKNHSRQISVAIFKVEAVQREAPGKYMHAHQINSNVLACKFLLSLLANSGYVSGRYEVECCRLFIFHFYYLLYCCFCYFAVVIVCIPIVASYDVVGFFHL